MTDISISADMEIGTWKEIQEWFFQALDGFLLMITQVSQQHNDCEIIMMSNIIISIIIWFITIMIMMIMIRLVGSCTSLRMPRSTLATVWKIFLSTETGFFIVSTSIKSIIIISITSISKSMMIIEICCSIYDIVDKQDHPTLHLHLARYPPPPPHHHHQHCHGHRGHHGHHYHDCGDGQGGGGWERAAEV